MLSSFDPIALGAARDLAPSWPRWLNVEGTLGIAEVDAALALGCPAIAADWRLITSRTAALVREAGLDLAAWTVRRRPTLRRLAALGVVAACVEGAALGG